MKKPLLLSLSVMPGFLTAAEPAQIKMQITGMKCPVCARNLENKLKNCDGVEKVKISYQDKQATVTFSAHQAADIESIRQVVKAAGFEAGEGTPVSPASDRTEVVK